MFIRVKTRNNTYKKAVQIVESFRQGKSVKQKVIQTIGYAYDDDTIEQLKILALNLKARLENQIKGGLFPDKDITQLTINAYLNRENSNKKLGVDLGDLSEIKNIISGIHSIYGIIYNIFDFNNLFTNRHISAKNILYNMVLSRLASPLSKRASVPPDFRKKKKKRFI